METNIEKFNYAALWILNRLYDQFPAQVVVNAYDIDPVPINDKKWDKKYDEDQKIYFGTVDFLIAENYVRHGQDFKKDGSRYNLVLTAKGLSALNRIPDSISGRKSLIEIGKDLLRKTPETASSAAVAELVKQLMN